jgi:hypothetical protein
MISHHSVPSKNQQETDRLKRIWIYQDSKIKRKWDLNLKNKTKVENKLKELQQISQYIHNQRCKLEYEFEDKIQAICNHSEYPVKKRMNMRDDASFQYWISCSNCNKDIGHE